MEIDVLPWRCSEDILKRKGSESHMKQWSVVMCCAFCVCVYVLITVSLLALNLADSYCLITEFTLPHCSVSVLSCDVPFRYIVIAAT